jgi:hypothetical protein
VQATTCIDGNDSDLVSTDSGSISAGIIYFYLVRAEDGCPDGFGTYGSGYSSASGSTPREGKDCN